MHEPGCCAATRALYIQSTAYSVPDQKRHGLFVGYQGDKRTGWSARTADASHVSGECLAKGVVVKHKQGYILAIVPASRQVRLEEVGRYLTRRLW